jgi:hypothetical protein
MPSLLLNREFTCTIYHFTQAEFVDNAVNSLTIPTMKLVSTKNSSSKFVRLSDPSPLLKKLLSSPIYPRPGPEKYVASTSRNITTVLTICVIHRSCVALCVKLSMVKVISLVILAPSPNRLLWMSLKRRSPKASDFME